MRPYTVYQYSGFKICFFLISEEKRDTVEEESTEIVDNPCQGHRNKKKGCHTKKKKSKVKIVLRPVHMLPSRPYPVQPNFGVVANPNQGVVHNPKASF